MNFTRNISTSLSDLSAVLFFFQVNPKQGKLFKYFVDKYLVRTSCWAHSKYKIFNTNSIITPNKRQCGLKCLAIFNFFMQGRETLRWMTGIGNKIRSQSRETFRNEIVWRVKRLRSKARENQCTLFLRSREFLWLEHLKMRTRNLISLLLGLIHVMIIKVNSFKESPDRKSMHRLEHFEEANKTFVEVESFYDEQ